MTKILKIDEETHQTIKVKAAQKGLTMREYISRLVKDAK